ncbi:hypothetical protein ACHAWU_001390 [Discostella pseudostelligera]|uniref:Nitroreductase domain-containing protein n=1 Tax=Discostella pseudostelligera TaxID=259834 RepID=A0ABD3M1Z8_9STRA
MLIMGQSSPSSSYSLATIISFSACPRRPLSRGATLAANSRYIRHQIYRSVALNESPPSSTAEASIPLEIATANTKNAAAIFDAVVNSRYACTRFHRYQEPNNDNDGNILGATNSSSSINNENKPATTLSSMTTKPSPEMPTASISNPQIIKLAHQSLILSQRAPSGFNAQPYRIILVHSENDKERVAQYCLGRNADRVRDSDCTAIFLADAGVGWDGGRYIDFLKRHTMQMNEVEEDTNNRNATSATTARTSTTSMTNAKPTSTSRSRRSLSPRELLKVRLLILLFSSGYPLPSFLSIPLSFVVRLGVSILATIMRWLHTIQQRLLLSSTKSHQRTLLSRIFSPLLSLLNIQLLPTLHTSQTWSQKNTMLVAMTYILSCTSHGLATCPMEGFDAFGIKKVLGVNPIGRYSIPLIVSTGMPYHNRQLQILEQQPQQPPMKLMQQQGEEDALNLADGEEEEATTTDDAGLSHGSGALLSPRYPSEDMIYENAFGMPFLQ